MLGGGLAPSTSDAELSDAERAVLSLLDERSALSPALDRVVWSDWVGLPGLASPPMQEALAQNEGAMQLVVADATDRRLAAWARTSCVGPTPWVLAWLTPHSLAITRHLEGQGCASCALFFDGELARTALVASPSSSPWLFSPALRALAEVMLMTAAQLPRETLPDHHAWWFDMSTLRAAVESVPRLPGCLCDQQTSHGDLSLPEQLGAGQRFAPVHPIAPRQEGQPWRTLYRGTRSLERTDRGAFGVAMASGDSAALRAQAEAIERFCMMHAPPDRLQQTASSLVSSCWQEELIASLLFSADQYATPDFRFAPFHGQLPLDWSWAESLETGQRALVPTSLVGHVDSPSVRLVDATSSGYAAHPVRAEAIAHALLELIERDALLLAWMAPRTLVRLEGVPLPAQCRAYWVPSDVDLPVVLLATPSPQGGLRMASAAALSLEQAVRKAAEELTVAQAPLSPRRGAYRLDEPAGRYVPADHVLFYDHPARCGPVLDWLGRAMSEDAQQVARRWPAPVNPASDQVRARLEAVGLEAWIVDRSMPRLFGSWHVVRAIIPGLTEISWGARYVRAAGARARALVAGQESRRFVPHPFG